MANVLNLATRSDDVDVYETLKYSDAYIVNLARKNIPRAIIPGEILDLEIDELVQRTRIKLWNALRHKAVTNIKSYIKSVVHTSCVDMIRERERTTSLIVNEEDEEFQGTVLLATSEGMRDPAYEVEREHTLTTSMEQAVRCVVALPQRQRKAMVCALKEHVDDLSLLERTFKEYGIDISKEQWPEGKEELHRTRVALTTARKKMKRSPFGEWAIS